jgi:hypothetical protein
MTEPRTPDHTNSGARLRAGSARGTCGEGGPTFAKQWSMGPRPDRTREHTHSGPTHDTGTRAHSGSTPGQDTGTLTCTHSVHGFLLFRGTAVSDDRGERERAQGLLCATLSGDFISKQVLITRSLHSRQGAGAIPGFDRNFSTTYEVSTTVPLGGAGQGSAGTLCTLGDPYTLLHLPTLSLLILRQSASVAQAGFELAILLSQPPE